MKTMKDIIDECVYGHNPKKSASEYRIAMATITAVYGPRGHKERREFSAVVDLDCKPVVNDAGMIVRVMTKRSLKFKKLPVVFVDFTHWTDWLDRRHEISDTDSFVFENFARKVTDTKANIAARLGFGNYDGDDAEESDAFDATGLDNEMTEIIIRSRLSNLVDESEDDIWERCRIESEAREEEEEEAYVREEYESHLQAIADLMRDNPWYSND